MVRELLLAVFVEVGLTFALLAMLGRARVRAVEAGEVRLKDIALGQNAWPERITKIGNAFRNQLELPVLFYVLAALALATRMADLPLVVLAWLFVAMRIVHAVIHVTHNHVRARFFAYVAGYAALVAMWVYFAVRVLTAGG